MSSALASARSHFVDFYLHSPRFRTGVRGHTPSRTLRASPKRPDRAAVSTLLERLAQRDPLTARHSSAVGAYGRELAAALGASLTDQRLVHTAGLLHDVGKLILPDSILRARHLLSEHDWTVIRHHPVAGAVIAAQVPGCEPVVEAIRHHHERIDGAGYPDGLAGDDIPWMSRVLSVADAYDAMTARGSYKAPRSVPDALEELWRVAGSQLDEAFVETFVELRADDHAAARPQVLV